MSKPILKSQHPQNKICLSVQINKICLLSNQSLKSQYPQNKICLSVQIIPRIPIHKFTHRNTPQENIFNISHTSYIFRANRLIRCVLDAVYKKILPTFLGAFLVPLSNFKKFIARCKVNKTCFLCIKTGAVTSAKRPIYDC